MRVYAVWQPMLATDFGPPITAVLARLSDRRVQQYWDRHHLIARKLSADARAPQPEPECCERSGILWDLAAVYPPGVRWDDRLPPATVFNGPVDEVSEAIGTAIASAQSPSRSGVVVQ